MLKLIRIRDPALRWRRLRGFDLQSDRCIVSDFKTKRAAEDFLLARFGSFAGSPVMRLREFQEELFYLSASSWRLVSENVLQALFSDFASRSKDPFVQNSARSRDFLFYFYRYLPLHLHPEGERLMEECLKKRDSLWTRYWSLSKSFFAYMRKKRVIAPGGLPAFVHSQIASLPEAALPFRKLIFDLGASIDSLDREFIKEIALRRPADLITPLFEEGDSKTAQEGDAETERGGAEGAVAGTAGAGADFSGAASADAGASFFKPEDFDSEEIFDPSTPASADQDRLEKPATDLSENLTQNKQYLKPSLSDISLPEREGEKGAVEDRVNVQEGAALESVDQPRNSLLKKTEAGRPDEESALAEKAAAGKAPLEKTPEEGMAFLSQPVRQNEGKAPLEKTPEEGMAFLSQPVRQNEGKALLEKTPEGGRQIFVQKSESALKEAAAAANQARRWRDQGVAEEEIALIAPDIEEYWPVLEFYLKEEGLTAQKGGEYVLADREEILIWLSLLRFHLSLHNFSDMETAYLHRRSPYKKRFSGFYADFWTAPSRSLSKRHLQKGRLRDSESLCSGKEFLKWVASLWPGSSRPGSLGPGSLGPSSLETSSLEQNSFDSELLEKSLQSFPASLEERLRYVNHLSLLEEGLFAPRSDGLEPDHGLSCLSLNALAAVRAPFVFIMGLNKNALVHDERRDGRRELARISLDLGFPLSFPDPYEQERNLLWLLPSDSIKRAVLSFASSDFQGEAQTPSLLWMRCKKHQLEREDSQTAQHAKADGASASLAPQMQASAGASPLQQAPQKIIENPPGPPYQGGRRKQTCSPKPLNPAPPYQGGRRLSERQDLQNRSSQTDIKEGRGDGSLKAPSPPFEYFLLDQFSPSSLKSYAMCPYIYWAEYVLNAKAPEPTERELSPLKTGDLMHKLLERMFNREKTGKDFRDLEKADIDSFIEELKPEESCFIEKGQWEISKKELLQSATALLENEQKLLQSCPDLKTVGVEVKAEGFWSRSKKRFLPPASPASAEVSAEVSAEALAGSGAEPGEGDILFQGRIDRIDYDPASQSFLIRDYKGSIDMRHIAYWPAPEKEELALLLYAMAVEEGVIEDLPPGKVRGLAFYSYKNLEVKGYAEKGGPFEAVFPLRGRGWKKERRFLEQTFEKAKGKIEDILSAVGRGEFAPRPADPATCGSCDYNRQCRAPHLS